MSRSWEEIKDGFYKVYEMSCRPQNIRRVPTDLIDLIKDVREDK